MAGSRASWQEMQAGTKGKVFQTIGGKTVEVFPNIKEGDPRIRGDAGSTLDKVDAKKRKEAIDKAVEGN